MQKTIGGSIQGQLGQLQHQHGDHDWQKQQGFVGVLIHQPSVLRKALLDALAEVLNHLVTVAIVEAKFPIPCPPCALERDLRLR